MPPRTTATTDHDQLEPPERGLQRRRPEEPADQTIGMCDCVVAGSELDSVDVHLRPPEGVTYGSPERLIDFAGVGSSAGPLPDLVVGP